MNKKSMEIGIKALLLIVLVIDIGIILIVILSQTTSVGQGALAKIKESIPFV